MTEVVSAVIIRNGRILLTQRREDKDFPFSWECPGGKVDGNESHHEAIRRELREELGCEIRGIANSALWCDELSNAVTRPDRARIFLLMYRVELTWTPQPQEKQGIGWFTADEMERLTLAPGNKAALTHITAAIRAIR